MQIFCALLNSLRKNQIIHENLKQAPIVDLSMPFYQVLKFLKNTLEIVNFINLLKQA